MPYVTTNSVGESFNADHQDGGRIQIDPNEVAKISDMFVKVYHHDASIAREMIVNGIESVMDAHDRYGKPKSKVTLELPESNHVTSGDTDNTSTDLVITDYGLGLSLDDFVNILMWFGRSTKDSNDEQGRKYVGGKGIGAKSGVYIASPFYYHIVKDGVKNIIEVYTDEGGMGWNLLNTDENFDGPNMVRIVIPYPEDSFRIRRFLNEMETLVSFFSKNDLEVLNSDMVAESVGKVADLPKFNNVTFAGGWRSSSYGYLNSQVLPTVRGVPYEYSFDTYESFKHLIVDKKANTTRDIISLLVYKSLVNGDLRCIVDLDHDDVQIPADRESLSTLTRTTNRIKSSIESSIELFIDDILEKVLKNSGGIEYSADNNPTSILKVIDIITNVISSDYGISNSYISISMSAHNLLSGDSTSINYSNIEDIVAPIDSDDLIRKPLIGTPLRTSLKAYSEFCDSDDPRVDEVKNRHAGIKYYGYRNQYVNINIHMNIAGLVMPALTISMDDFMDATCTQKGLEAGKFFLEDRKHVNAVYRRVTAAKKAAGHISTSRSSAGRPHTITEFVTGSGEDPEVVYANMRDIRKVVSGAGENDLVVIHVNNRARMNVSVRNRLQGFYDRIIIVSFDRAEFPGFDNGEGLNTKVVSGGYAFRLLFEKLTGEPMEGGDTLEYRLYEMESSGRSCYPNADTIAYSILILTGIVTSKVVDRSMAATHFDRYGRLNENFLSLTSKMSAKLSDEALPRYNSKDRSSFNLTIPSRKINKENVVSIINHLNALQEL